MPSLEILNNPDTARAYYAQKLVESHVPEGLREGLLRYLVDRIPTGHFLLAILANDLRAACERADMENRYRLFDIVYFLYNYAPSGAWGSHENVREWLEARPR
jgi:hypothetical protein